MTHGSVSEEVDLAASTGMGRRTFWGIFWGAWGVYGVIACSAALAEGTSLGRSLVTAAVALSSHLLPALCVVWGRRWLLQVDRPIKRTVALHALVGLLSAVAGAGLLFLLARAFDLQPPEPWEGKWAFLFFAQVVNGLFLYAILLGFLMWTESVDRIHEGRTMVARARMLRAEAEAKALRAQFSPHFVFNALHSMIQLIRIDPDAAERSIEDMAGLIRYGSILQKRASSTVPLAVEASVAQRYLALESMRLGNRLTYAVRIEPGLESVAVPALTLQTLLENAVQHGIAPLEEGGSVDLSVFTEGEDLVIRVTDDGAGADASALHSNHEGGLGLLSRRLANIYGDPPKGATPASRARDTASEPTRDRASLRWDTRPGGGFAATVRVPRTKAEPWESAVFLPPRAVGP